MSALAGSAALLHAMAYVLYLSGTLRRKVDPAPASWLMWAYGTALVVVIETDQGIDPLLVLLPVVCAACSIAVALVCYLRGASLWPSNGVDRGALGTDVVLTLVYVAIAGGASLGLFAERGAGAAKAVLLGILGVSTVVSFIPTLRAVRRDPSREDNLAWIMWTIAYTMLLLVTFVGEGVRLSAIQFWVYPGVCAVLSGLVVWSAVGSSRARQRPDRYRGPSSPAYPATRCVTTKRVPSALTSYSGLYDDMVLSAPIPTCSPVKTGSGVALGKPPSSASVTSIAMSWLPCQKNRRSSLHLAQVPPLGETRHRASDAGKVVT